MSCSPQIGQSSNRQRGMMRESTLNRILRNPFYAATAHSVDRTALFRLMPLTQHAESTSCNAQQNLRQAPHPAHAGFQPPFGSEPAPPSRRNPNKIARICFNISNDLLLKSYNRRQAHHPARAGSQPPFGSWEDPPSRRNPNKIARICFNIGNDLLLESCNSRRAPHLSATLRMGCICHNSDRSKQPNKSADEIVIGSQSSLKANLTMSLALAEACLLL